MAEKLLSVFSLRMASGMARLGCWEITTRAPRWSSSAMMLLGVEGLVGGRCCAARR